METRNAQVVINLTASQVDAIADQLSNNEYSSDLEFKVHLINELKVPGYLANQAVKLRNKFLINPLASLHYDNGRLVVK